MNSALAPARRPSSPTHSSDPMPDAPMDPTDSSRPERPERPERPSDYAIYKPNQRGSGGVFRFELNVAKAAVFVEAASQSGERQFDWQRKITMKWGLADLGAMLATLGGRQAQAKLFHQSAKANSAFEFAARDDPQRAPYLMSLSRQESADQSVRKVSIPLTHAEAAVLEVLLASAVRRLQGW